MQRSVHAVELAGCLRELNPDPNKHALFCSSRIIRPHSPLQASPLEAPVVELLGKAFDACRDFAANDGDFDRLQWHARTVCRARNTVFDRAFAGERSVTTRLPYVGNGSLSCDIQTPSQLQLLRATTSHHSPVS